MNIPDMLMTATKKILLIDDQILFREGLVG
jgi:hypothetical protein